MRLAGADHLALASEPGYLADPVPLPADSCRRLAWLVFHSKRHVESSFVDSSYKVLRVAICAHYILVVLLSIKISMTLF
jgi:hypothetical protein